MQQHMSKTAALRATANRYRVRAEFPMYRVYDVTRGMGGTTVPDYWEARDIAIRWRAAAALRLMGMSPGAADAAVTWAIERGETTARDIVACAAEGL